MKRLLAVIVLLLVAFSARLHGQVVMRVEARPADGADRELTVTRSEYAALLNGRDAAGVSSLYTTDALVVLSDGERLSGAGDREPFHEAAAIGRATRERPVDPQRFEIAASASWGRVRHVRRGGGRWPRRDRRIRHDLYARRRPAVADFDRRPDDRRAAARGDLVRRA